MSYEEPIEYVPAVKSQSVVWKICRNLAVLWAVAIAVMYFASIETNVGPSAFFVLATPSILLVVIGLAFRR